MKRRSMWRMLSVLLFFAVGLVVTTEGDATREDDEDSFSSTNLRTIVTHLARQVQLQQFALEERTRMDGGSGLKQQRTKIIGSRPTNTLTHTGFTVAAIHDHADHVRTVGMGESVYVMNGVEFRTRHNDYPIYMPHPTSQDYNAAQPVPFPDVPRSVLDKENVADQVAEMKKYFTAWADQDDSEVDYKPYFKPVLCYLEGGWTKAVNKLEEAFFSDRHFIDADSWLDLQEKVRYNAFVGRKNLDENFAYLPRIIINITETGLPVYAQWNYRILCHPLKNDLPLDALVQEDDLQARLLYRKTLREYSEMRGARFRVEGVDEKRMASYTLLDKLMTEIPGRNNYQGELTETSLGDIYTDPAFTNDTLLNVAYFHRRYNFGQPDASGLKTGKRGYTDSNMWLAETTQEEIAPLYVRMCETKGTKKCYEVKKRVTYAIPLEIIYLTPLYLWNPYKIDFAENPRSKEMTDNGKRNGGFTKDTAYKASGPKLYYRTPAEFFVGGDVSQRDAADTAVSVVGMLGEDGEVRNVTASGCRTFLPEIENLGDLRLRFPIMPVHGEGGSVWKELDALKSVVMRLKSYEKYLYEKLPTTSSTSTKSKSSSSSSSSSNNNNNNESQKKILAYLVMKMSKSPKDDHLHLVNMTAKDRQRLMKGKTLKIESSEVNGHKHKLLVAKEDGKFYIVKADGKQPPTADGHNDRLDWSIIGYTDGTMKVKGQRRKRWAHDPLDEIALLVDDDDEESDDVKMFGEREPVEDLF